MLVVTIEFGPRSVPLVECSVVVLVTVTTVVVVESNVVSIIVETVVDV